MSDQKFVSDVAEALLRLNRVLAEHGMKPVKAIAVGDHGDFTRFRSLRPDNNYVAYPEMRTVDREVAATIVGVQVRLFG